jgi:hypothetical protein
MSFIGIQRFSFLTRRSISGASSRPPHALTRRLVPLRAPALEGSGAPAARVPSWFLCPAGHLAPPGWRGPAGHAPPGGGTSVVRRPGWNLPACWLLGRRGYLLGRPPASAAF